MNKRRWIGAFAIASLIFAVGVSLAQSQGRGGRRGYWGGGSYELPSDRAGVPDWEADPQFEKDVFTFVRVEYDSYRGRGRRGAGWDTDWPDSDLNFSYRLQQLTSLKVNPDPVILRLTDKKLFDYPFLYMIEPGEMYLSEDEVAALRKYLAQFTDAELRAVGRRVLSDLMQRPSRTIHEGELPPWPPSKPPSVETKTEKETKPRARRARKRTPAVAKARGPRRRARRR